MKSWLVAHRGAPHEAKENTHAAFAAAKKHPIAFIEFDVQVTKDNIAVIHHDPLITNLAIADSSYTELLNAENDLATFEDVISNNQTQPLMVELKSQGSAGHAIAYLKTHSFSCATSFLPEELTILQTASIDGKRLFLAQHYHPFGIVRKATVMSFGGITVQKWLINPLLYYFARQHGLNVMVYTVNSRLYTRIIRLLYPKALICTDVPHRLSDIS